MQYDPYTLIVALQDGKDASGELYMDDGTTFDYLQGDAIHRVFTYTKGTLSSKRRAPVWTTVIQPVEQAMEHVHIENIVVLGQRPIHVLSADQQEFQTVCFAEGCMVQNVQLSLVRDWSISFVY
jgi:alpha-glucosidase (family GH31 glycosyl hydrolase)